MIVSVLFLEKCHRLVAEVRMQIVLVVLTQKIVMVINQNEKREALRIPQFFFTVVVGF